MASSDLENVDDSFAASVVGFVENSVVGVGDGKVDRFVRLSRPLTDEEHAVFRLKQSVQLIADNEIAEVRAVPAKEIVDFINKLDEFLVKANDEAQARRERDENAVSRAVASLNKYFGELA